MEIKQPQMGSGMAQGAAEVAALLPKYRDLKITAAENGNDFPPFDEWLKSQDGQNALKIMPRR